MGVLKICIVVVNTPLHDSIIKKWSWIRLDIYGHLFSDRLEKSPKILKLKNMITIY